MNAFYDFPSIASTLDRPEILRFLFHPRKAPVIASDGQILEITVNAGDEAVIGCRCHLTGKESPTILFFHGNGEIAHDYDTIGPLYNSHGLNFIVADYRGYGISTGTPTISAMLSDAETVFDSVCETLSDSGYTGPFWIMGRSLGSAPAVRLAASRMDHVAGLIIESGFAGVRDLLEQLGILSQGAGIDEAAFFSNADVLRQFDRPVLVIHAEHDHIIPLSHGKELHESAPDPRKGIQVINGADHNNIFALAGMKYFEYIKNFIDANGAST